MRAFHILLIAALLMGGCQSYEIEVAPSNEIAFDAQQITRGAMTQEDINRSSVYIYGVQNNTTKIYNNAAITRDAATGKWFPSSKRSWVEGSSYSFYGYAYNTTNGLTLVSGKDGLEIEVRQPTTYNEAAMID